MLAGCTAEGPSDAPTTAPTAGAQTSAPPADPQQVVPAAPLTADELASYGGVAMLTGPASCTGTLVETGDDAAPAYLLTNGHCVGLDGSPVNTSIVDAEAEGEARFFNVAGADASSVLTVPVARYEYGTMRGRDIGIVRLDATLGELRTAGATPLAIASAAPATGTAVVNVAGPVDGVPEDEQVLRKGECVVGGSTDVVESSWLWFGATRTDCPGVLGGSSGSPLIADGTVVSIINTTNGGIAAADGVTCYRGMPCEPDGTSATFVQDSSYGVDVAGLDACFAGGTFALGGECPLVATTWDGVDGGGTFGATGSDEFGTVPAVTFSGAAAGEYVVSHVLPLGDVRGCTDPATYAGGETVTVKDSAEHLEVPVTLPTDNGFAVVCVAKPGQEADAARFVYAIDTVAPAAGPELVVLDLGDEGFLVDPLFAVPEISNVELHHGPADETDCADRSAYTIYRRQSLMIEASAGPTRVCAVGFDMGGNESPVTEKVIGGE